MNVPAVVAHAAAAIVLVVALAWELVRRRRMARAHGWVFWAALIVVLASGGVLLVRSTPLWMIYGAARDQVTSPAGVLAAARATVRDAGVCFFITLDESGRPDARMMQPFPLDPDMSVWLATQRGTRKLAQLARDPRASVACYDPATIGYVTMIGSARVVEDSAQRRLHYSHFWDQFFQGPQDPTYTLIHVIPVRLEVVSYGRSVATRAPRWRAATLVAQQGRWVAQP